MLGLCSLQCSHSCTPKPAGTPKERVGTGMGTPTLSSGAREWVHPNSLAEVEGGGCHGPPTHLPVHIGVLEGPPGMWDCIPNLFHRDSHSPIALATPGMVTQRILQGDVSACALPMLGVPSRGDERAVGA